MTEHYMATDGNVYVYRTAGSRPVFVIDPGATEQVKRLAFMCSLVRYDGGASDGSASHLQEALLALIAPPKPEEPTGLGAVIEDTGGVQWVRLTGYRSAAAPWRSVGRITSWTAYDAIEVAVVRSEGVSS